MTSFDRDTIPLFPFQFLSAMLCPGKGDVTHSEPLSARWSNHFSMYNVSNNGNDKRREDIFPGFDMQSRVNEYSGLFLS